MVYTRLYTWKIKRGWTVAIQYILYTHCMPLQSSRKTVQHHFLTLTKLSKATKLEVR